jgi:nanoRNase/pAp phosphatase (c-di-AMP/oligoRNAs hydrolase)
VPEKAHSVCADSDKDDVMKKVLIPTIHEKNRIIENIIEAMLSRNRFLLLGHRNPDEDCIASMVAFSLLLGKVYKPAKICLGEKVHEHYQYLLHICRFNSITLFEECAETSDDFDTVVICDTPKPSMTAGYEHLRSLFENPEVLKIEIDHHLGADSRYIGDEGYRLVTEATSSSELVGHIALKMRNRKDLAVRYQIDEVFSRNITLAILTGIIGDTNMGQFLKSRREGKFYRIFSTMLNSLLTEETVKESNFKNTDEVYRELHRLSTREERCFRFFMDRKKFSASVGYVALEERDTKVLFSESDEETVVNVARAVANDLAEESGKLSLVAYYDSPELSEFVQFRIRRSQQYKKYDLRTLLELFGIENGGGHEGAIGFRIHRNGVSDYVPFVHDLIEGIEKVLPP